MEIEQVKAFSMKCPVCSELRLIGGKTCERCGGTGKIWIALRPEKGGVRALEVFLCKKERDATD